MKIFAMECTHDFLHPNDFPGKPLADWKIFVLNICNRFFKKVFKMQTCFNAVTPTTKCNYFSNIHILFFIFCSDRIKKWLSSVSHLLSTTILKLLMGIWISMNILGCWQTYNLHKCQIFPNLTHNLSFHFHWWSHFDVPQQELHICRIPKMFQSFVDVNGFVEIMSLNTFS